MSDRETYRAEIEAALARAGRSAFTWGESDCLMWLADIYRRAAGLDLAAAYRGRYRTAAGAIAVLGPDGVAGALEAAASAAGWPEIDPGAGETGDLGMIETADRGPAGVIRYGAFWSGRTPYGFSAWRTACVVKAWRVCDA